MQTKQAIVSLLRLCIGLGIIVGVTALLVGVAAALVVGLEQILFAPSEEAAVPGLRLLRAVIGAEPSGVIVALAVSLVAYLALAIGIVTEARLRGGADWRDLVAWHPWNPRRSDRRVYALAAAALAYGVVADFLLRYLAPQTGPWLTVPPDPAGAIIVVLVATIAAPLAEELLFRGWMYTDLRGRFGFVTTLVVTSATFAWLHYESTHLYALAVFPIGLALGAMREITGSVKPAIAFHAFNNFLACLGF